MDSSMKVGVVGAGTMGSGIAQVAAQSGHAVVLFDTRQAALDHARTTLGKVMDRLVEKGKLDREAAKAVQGRITYATELEAMTGSGLVIEAIVEDLPVKQDLFKRLEDITGPDAVLATNTSSLSITAIGGPLSRPGRLLGLHFFNPAPLLPLVEVVPGLATDPGLAAQMSTLMKTWGKVPVIAKDTPGFIVNRVARPFYGEALRIYEEGIADMVTIDHAMKEVGGFRMGPFELMDLIGNDVNFAVTKSVFEAFFFDPRYRPSLTQQRMVEAGWLGRKSGRGYYAYAEADDRSQPTDDALLWETIVERIVAMLINEAVDALHLGIAGKDDLDLAMTKGVNYPKGLLEWADDKGAGHWLSVLEGLNKHYQEDRYRPSPLLRAVAAAGTRFK